MTILLCGTMQKLPSPVNVSFAHGICVVLLSDT
jgi:hypothetical protein